MIPVRMYKVSYEYPRSPVVNGHDDTKAEGAVFHGIKRIVSWETEMDDERCARFDRQGGLCDWRKHRNWI